MASKTTRKLNLALQGGGSHGAFTWGVLDRLLEDESIEISAISGTSAGAMNAVVCGEGLMEGDRAHARAQLDHFWHGMGDTAAKLSPFQRTRLAADDRRLFAELLADVRDEPRHLAA